MSGNDRVCACVLQAKRVETWAEAHMGAEVEVCQVTVEPTTLIITGRQGEGKYSEHQACKYQP